MDALYISKTSLLSGGGGGERRADAVSKRLAERGHDVVVLSGKTAPGLPTWSEHEGRQIRHVTIVPDAAFRFETASFFLTRYLFPLVSLPVLLSLLLCRDFDVIVENMTPYPTLAVLLAQACSVPIVAVQHEFFDSECFEVYDPVTATIQLTLQNFLRVFEYRSVIVPTSHVKRQFVDYGIDADRLSVIPNGVEYDRYQVPEHEHTEGRLVTVGRLTKRKGQATILRSVADLRERGRDVRLDVVGSGPASGQLRELVEELGIEDSVTFHGYVTEETKIELLNRADLFVFASLQEGFGIVLLEAMSAGLPVVARDLPVYHDFFRDGDNGRLVSDGPETFADAVEALVTDRDAVASMRSRNKRDAKRYAWTAVADETESLLQSAIENNTLETESVTTPNDTT